MTQATLEQSQAGVQHETAGPTHLLKAGAVIVDDWHEWVPSPQSSEENGNQHAASDHFPPDEPHWIVPLSFWLKNEATLRARQHSVGIRVDPADDPFDLVTTAPDTLDPTGIALIAVAFPNFNDGRGYSHAYTLRAHLGWHGELRAVGDVLIDTMFYLARCGFDSYAVKPGHDPHAALDALNTFSQRYQRGYTEVATAPRR